jgi:hypothetical protein
MNSTLLTSVTPKTNQERLAEWRSKVSAKSARSLEHSLDSLEQALNELERSYRKPMYVPLLTQQVPQPTFRLPFTQAGHP